MTRATIGLLSSCLSIGLATVAAHAGHGVDENSTAPYARASANGGAAGSSTDSTESARVHGFRLTSPDGDSEVLIGGRLQATFDFIDWDDALARDNTVTFGVRRARLYLVGHVMGEPHQFFVQIGADTPDPLWSRGEVGRDFELLDGWFKYVRSEGFAVKLGQFKKPFGRQGLTSSGRLQLASRSLATETLGTDLRDTGIEFSGELEQGMLHYAAALINGDGPNRLNLDNHLAFSGRLSLNPTGDYGYSEGDMEMLDEVASTLGVSAQYASVEVGETDTDELRFGIDGGAKYRGVSIQGELFLSKHDPADSRSLTDKSYYLQSGYFVSPERVEIAARISQVMPEVRNHGVSEYTLGLNVYSWGHRLKWQAAYSLVDDDATQFTTHRVVSLAQLWF